jgi:MazG family protein
VSGPGSIDRLLEIMRRLRDPARGCPWDREQTFDTIAPYTIEEAYEVADCIERRDHAALCSELGDLLFQVVFHARLAEERGLFGFAEVVDSISEKLTARHPHVFASETITTSAEQNAAWERHKASERTARGLGVLDDVPLSLPALKRAQKLGKRAASVGFDWSSANGPRETLTGELAELDATIAARGPHAAILEELGDVLFSAVNLARHLGVDAEEALRSSNAKFMARFAEMERLATGHGKRLSQSTPGELEALWQDVKKRLR